MVWIKGTDQLPEKEELNRPELFNLEQNHFDDHIIYNYKIMNNRKKANMKPVVHLFCWYKELKSFHEASKS